MPPPIPINPASNPAPAPATSPNEIITTVDTFAPHPRYRGELTCLNGGVALKSSENLVQGRDCRKIRAIQEPMYADRRCWAVRQSSAKDISNKPGFSLCVVSARSDFSIDFRSVVTMTLPSYCERLCLTAGASEVGEGLVRELEIGERLPGLTSENGSKSTLMPARRPLRKAL